MMRSPSVSLTFTDAVPTWSGAMKTKQMGAIDEMLSQEFTWDSVNNESSTSRKDTMEWIASTNFSIGNFTTIYNGGAFFVALIQCLKQERMKLSSCVLLNLMRSALK